MSKTAELTIETQAKPTGLNPRQIRSAGNLPITVYGKNFPAKSLQINAHSFKLTHRANPDASYTLKIDGKDVKAVVQDVQVNYATSEFLNVEFKTV